MTAAASALDSSFLIAFRDGTLTREQAEAAISDGDHAAFIFLLLQIRATLGVQPTSGPHTPPSTVPTYNKPSSQEPRKPRGARNGHAGHACFGPVEIDHREALQLFVCPKCGGALQRTGQTRTSSVTSACGTARETLISCFRFDTVPRPIGTPKTSWMNSSAPRLL